MKFSPLVAGEVVVAPAENESEPPEPPRPWQPFLNIVLAYPGEPPAAAIVAKGGVIPPATPPPLPEMPPPPKLSRFRCRNSLLISTPFELPVPPTM